MATRKNNEQIQDDVLKQAFNDPVSTDNRFEELLQALGAQDDNKAA